MSDAVSECAQRLLFGLLYVLALGFASVDPSPAGIVVSPPVDPVAAEAQWRWIGLMPNGPVQLCPEPLAGSGWETNEMFPGTANVQLARYCLYTRDDAGDPAPLFDLTLDEIARDRMAVAGEGSELRDLTWETLQEHAWAQAAQVSLAGYEGEVVRLTLLDSVATAIAAGEDGPEDLAGSSNHGTALANLLRDLVCDVTETDCRAVVASRLALAYTCFDPLEPAGCRNEIEGGQIGLIGELAQAIHTEVNDWSAGGPGAAHLVLNLSVAWNGRFGGREQPRNTMPPDVQAVYLALEDATCRGVLPIAAVGNSQPGPNPEEGALFPAAWEQYAAPSLARCQSLGITPPPEMMRFEAYRPFVHAVGGVQQGGLGVFNVRRRAEPRLVAFGDHAVVESSDSGLPTATLTGSSVATAVTAAAAAVFWSQRAELNAAEVASQIHAAGLGLGRDADFCIGGAPCSRDLDVRRVSVCAALARACSEGACLPPVCPIPPALSLADIDFSSFEDPGETSQLSLPDAREVLGVFPVCQNDTSRHDADGVSPVDPCPHYQYHGGTAEPWIDPQAEQIPCPDCTIRFTGNGTLYLEIDDSWIGSLSEATFKCGPDVFSLGLPTLTAGSRARVTDIPNFCRSRDHLLLSFTLDGDRSAIAAPHRVTE